MGTYHARMELGTWGEWFAAVATLGATLAALYLGARDETRRLSAQQARTRVRNLARERLRHMDRWEAQIEEPDQDTIKDSPTMDAEAAEFVKACDELSTRRTKRADRLISTIYGERSVLIARLYPERRSTVIRAPGAKAEVVGIPAGEGVTQHLLKINPSLVLDRDPGPLRRRGAGSDVTERAELRRAFQSLANL